MGVHGLWRLIEPSGKPVPVETLENKVLGVDVSIWLHQAIKGFQDSKGAPLPNAHLLGIYHRVCKLLYFKVKPVFVFDGGVPVLKKQTIAKRNTIKQRNVNEADKLQKQLLATLIKHSAINKVISEKAKAAISSPPKLIPKERDDIFKLPPSELDSTISSSDEEEYTTTDSSTSTKHWDMHNIDTNSTHFKSLPVDVRHEILTDLKETRKQSSWGRLHELPTISDDFSCFQMKRLLKRQEVQTALEEAEKEMGGHTLSLGELENLLKEQGVISNVVSGQRIASDENTRYLFIKDVKQAMELARKREQEEKEIEENLTKDGKKEEPEINDEQMTNQDCGTSNAPKLSKADLEFENELQTAIALSLECEQSTSSYNSETFRFSNSTNFVRYDEPSTSSYKGGIMGTSTSTDVGRFRCDELKSDSDEEIDSTKFMNKLTPAQSYMKEYSGLTPCEIAKIIANNSNKLPIRRNSTHKADLLTIIDESETKSTAVKKTVQSGSTALTDDNKIHENATQNITSETKSIQLLDKKQGDEDIELMSNSDSEDDFLEISDCTSETKPVVLGNECLEIKIEPNKAETDDLFSDIFTNPIIEVIDTKEDTKFIENSKFIERKENGKVDADVILDGNIKAIMKKQSEEENDLKKVKVDLLSIEVTKNEYQRVESSNDKEIGNNSLPATIIPALTVNELKEMKMDLDKKEMELRTEKSTKERLAGNITDQMYQEAQELLELFGVPYIIAPMEAEAQCAFLDSTSLTEGTITDDSDIWLFGGKTVYKNFFNQSKHVLEFRAENIQHHFKLTREQMILLALLVGSDYTTGLHGVGPVTALEILAAFPPNSSTNFTLSYEQMVVGLAEFKSWFNSKKMAGRGKNTLRNKLKNVSFTDSFPSTKVVQAYLEPEVDNNKEKFTWGKPDFVGLIDFARTKFGWTQLKSEEILKPVIKKLEETRHQTSIKNYFKTKHKLDSGELETHMSKRVRSAVKRIGQDPTELDEEIGIIEEKRIKKKGSKENAQSKDVANLVESTSNDLNVLNGTSGNKKKRQYKRKVSAENNLKLEAVQGVESMADSALNTKKQYKKNSTLKLTDKQDKLLGEEVVKKKIRSYRKKGTINPSKVATKPITNVGNTLSTPVGKTANNLSNIDEQDEVMEKSKSSLDEDIKILQETQLTSQKRVEEIKKDVTKQIETALSKTRSVTRSLHQKEVIHQKLREKSDILKSKLRAIEIFRKSKQGPGFVKKSSQKSRSAKQDADLSESSESD